MYIRKLLLAVACVILAAPGLLQADVTGTILGVVTDASSALVQGVRIVATNLDTNLEKETKTDGNGQYRLLALPAGRYRLQAEFSGFQTFVATDIVLTVNEQRRMDVVLQVGTTQQEVSVSADAVQVETTNTQLGEVIEEKRIMSLPLNGRGYLDLLGLQPGVAPTSSRNEGPGTVSVNGQRENSNGFLVNGSDVAGVGDFEAQIQPNLDAVQEFRLITNSFDAEYGRFSGSIMNTITKSGTNAFHGTLFEFVRNDALDARGFFDNGKGKLRLNQFGYAVGGPAIKDKLFWFSDYQGSRRIDGGSSSEVQVLSEAERRGQLNVAHLTGTVTGPYWAQTLSQRLGRTVTDGQPYSTVFPDGVIPESAFSSAAKGTMGFIPLANRGSDIYVSSTEPIRTRDDMLGQRVDFLHQRTGNWSGYYYFQDTDVNDPFGDSSFLGLASASRARRQQGTLSNVKVFGPTTVNEFRVSYVGIIRRSVPASDAPPVESLGFLSGVNTLASITPAPAVTSPCRRFR
ncbi:MAG: carboxypeptidase regulatory-like domain-containing protein [Bryobacteraceae bacterium]|nr:carboxypeptidase regulatory-like domain-containing protein [Bryobacteraceae bacterium]